MKYFSEAFIQFFANLSQNNHKDWFSENRSIYEKEVKQPFNKFIAVLIESIRDYEPELIQKPSDVIFRINRDIRFSKDKTPYKTHVGAYISSRGKKDPSWPGLYVQLSNEHVMIASGVYMPDKETLANLRYYIYNNLDTFKELYSEAEFINTFGEIKGEKQKRIPADLKEAAEVEPLLYNKQFYYEKHLSAKVILEENLHDSIMEYYLATRPLNNFFKNIV